ncbi:hypothetical protein [Micromonospora gifhornensis]
MSERTGQLETSIPEADAQPGTIVVCQVSATAPRGDEQRSGVPS